jgi:hypothetical protein
VKLALVFPDAEIPAKDYIKDRFADLGEDVTVAIGVPSSWSQTNPTQKPHVQVAWDGTPIVLRNLAGFATLRVTAWARSTGEAKRLAALAQGVLCGHPGGDVIKGAAPLTGVLPAQDPDTHAEIAATTSRVTIRSAPIEPQGS